VRREPGTAWIVAEALKAHQTLGLPIVADPRSPTAGVIDELRRAGVEVVEVTTAEYLRARAALQQAVANVKVRHFGDQPLDAAVVGADVRPVGESWAWSQRASSVDITPLLSATLALGAWNTPAIPRAAGFGVRDRPVR